MKQNDILWQNYFSKIISIQNNSKSFSSVEKCVLVLIIFHCNTLVKIISSSNIFLSSQRIKYFFRNATIYNGHNKGNTFMIQQIQHQAYIYSLINILKLFLRVKCLNTPCDKKPTLLMQWHAIFLTLGHLFLCSIYSLQV